MKSKLFFIFLVIFIAVNPVKTVNAQVPISQEVAVENSFESFLEQLLQGLNLDDLQSFFDEYVGDLYQNSSLKNIISEALSGNNNLEFSHILSMFFQIFMKDIKSILPIFFSVIAIAVLSGVIEKIGSEKSKLSDVVFAFCYLTVAILLFSECSAILNNTKTVIEGVCKQTEGVFPLLVTLVTLCGANSSVKILKPICVFISGGILQIITKILFPIVSAIFVINLVSNLNERYSLKKFSDFAQSTFKWIVGITIAVFSFFVTVNGFGSSVFDSVTLRSLKYTVGNTVPIIGSFAKEGIDMVVIAGVLLKNSIGSIALTVIFCALLNPLLSIIAYSLALKFLAAIIQPIADNRICNLIEGFSKGISLLSILLIMTFIVYFVVIFMFICVQNTMII